jgi:hypothetical protein
MVAHQSSRWHPGRLGFATLVRNFRHSTFYIDRRAVGTGDISTLLAVVKILPIPNIACFIHNHNRQINVFEQNISPCPLTGQVKKTVPLHAMEALGGRGDIAPTHSRPRY